jgi:hypothetical protein
MGFVFNFIMLLTIIEFTNIINLDVFGYFLMSYRKLIITNRILVNLIYLILRGDIEHYHLVPLVIILAFLTSTSVFIGIEKLIDYMLHKLLIGILWITVENHDIGLNIRYCTTQIILLTNIIRPLI